MIGRSVMLLILSTLSADELAHLAALKRSDGPGLRARRQLGPDALDELASILLRGHTPTIGWWQRNTLPDNSQRAFERHVAAGRAFGARAVVARAGALETAA